MKPALILRTYAWLYHTIRNDGPLTFRQINEMWMADKRLSDGEPMVRQTFARHRNDLEDILGVRIDCDKLYREQLFYADLRVHAPKCDGGLRLSANQRVY